MSTWCIPKRCDALVAWAQFAWFDAVAREATCAPSQLAATADWFSGGGLGEQWSAVARKAQGPRRLGASHPTLATGRMFRVRDCVRGFTTPFRTRLFAEVAGLSEIKRKAPVEVR